MSFRCFQCFLHRIMLDSVRLPATPLPPYCVRWPTSSLPLYWLVILLCSHFSCWRSSLARLVVHLSCIISFDIFSLDPPLLDLSDFLGTARLPLQAPHNHKEERGGTHGHEDKRVGGGTNSMTMTGCAPHGHDNDWGGTHGHESTHSHDDDQGGAPYDHEDKQGDTHGSGGAPLATVTHHAPTVMTTAGQSTHQRWQHNRGHTTPMAATAAARCTTPPTTLNGSDPMWYPMAVTQQGTPSSDADGCDLTRHPRLQEGQWGWQEWGTTTATARTPSLHGLISFHFIYY